MATALSERAVTRVKVSEDRTFGVEIECVSPKGRARVADALRSAGIYAYSEEYNHYVRDYWKIITDASVIAESGSGYKCMEVVSPPLKGKEGMRALKRVLSTLNELGAEVNPSCGLHVHHDVTNLTTDELRNVGKFYLVYEEAIDGFVTPNRRENNCEYCEALRLTMFRHGFEEAFDTMDEWQTDDDFIYGWRHRQVTLNMQCLYRGTIEFRHHDATLDYADMAYWIAFTQSIVEAAHRKRVEIKRVPHELTPESMFRMLRCQPIVKRHFLERIEVMKYAQMEDMPYGYTFINYDDDDYDDDDDYGEDDPWMDDEQVFNEWDDVGYNIPGCNCPVCVARRSELMGGN